MNQEQEDRTCIDRSGLTAWIIHTCNIIFSLAICLLSFGCLGVTLWFYFNVSAPSINGDDVDVKGPEFMDSFLTLLLVKWETEGEPKDWASFVRVLSSTSPHTNLYIFLLSLFTMGMCALLNAGYSMVLLSKPRLHYAYYLPTWMYGGKLLWDGALLFALDTKQEAVGPVVFLCCISWLSDLFQLIMHSMVSDALYKRDSGVRSFCLPWNITDKGDVQCC